MEYLPREIAGAGFSVITPDNYRGWLGFEPGAF
jgi:hypothetical protein